LAVYRFITGRF